MSCRRICTEAELGGFGARGELGVHDNAAVLPFQLPEILLGAAPAVNDGGIDFGVIVFLEDIEDGGTVF